MKTCYNHYEVSAIKQDGADAIMTTDDDDPDVCGYALYGRHAEGHAVWISDHDTRAEADAAHNMKPERPTIVCLCGSTRFIEAFRAANLRETIAGKIVLSIGCDTKSDTDLIALGELTEEAKAALDELHKRKIDLADEVVILNVGGYVGKSTLSEIIYAHRLKKPLRWLEAMQCPCCKGRGGFDSAEDSHECALCGGAGRVANPLIL